MGLGMELPLLLAIGFVVLGPKRMQTMLGHVARAKAELHKASRRIKSQLPGEIEAALQDGRNDDETSSGARHRKDGTHPRVIADIMGTRKCASPWRFTSVPTLRILRRRCYRIEIWSHLVTTLHPNQPFLYSF